MASREIHICDACDKVKNLSKAVGTCVVCGSDGCNYHLPISFHLKITIERDATDTHPQNSILDTIGFAALEHGLCTACRESHAEILNSMGTNAGLSEALEKMVAELRARVAEKGLRA